MIKRKFEIKLTRFGDMEKYAEGELIFPRNSNVVFPPNLTVVCPDTGNVWMKVRFQMPGKWSVNWRVLSIKAFTMDLEKFFLREKDVKAVEGDEWFNKLWFMMLMNESGQGGFEFYETDYYTKVFNDI